MKTIGNLLSLSEAEEKYVEFVQLVVSKYAEQHNGRVRDYAKQLEGAVSSKRDTWAEVGVPYNTQDILTHIVLEHAQRGIKEPLPEYIGKNPFARAKLAKQIEAEREFFRQLA